jgi:hypothetical protein
VVKRISLTILQFIAFIGLLAVGGNWDAVNLSLELRQLQNNQVPHVLLPTLKYPVSSTHILIANGILFATVLLLLILLIEVLSKKLKPWAALTLLAYVLAVILGFAMKLGLPPASTPDSSALAPLVLSAQG